jgi:rod shape determining protein RodA
MTMITGAPDHPHPSIGEKLQRIPWTAVLVLSAIAGIGLVTLYSVAGGSLAPWAEHHALRFLGCLGLALLIAITPRMIWVRAAYPAYAIALALLVAVAIDGSEAGGARRWLDIAGVRFQPAEFMKIALILALARYYQWLPQQRISHPLALIVPLVLIALPTALTLHQPDLGTAVLFCVVGLGLMYLAGVHIAYFVSGAVTLAGTMPLIWASLHDYQRRRIEAFLNPDADPLGAGYHIAQSKIALGSGGLMGKGLLHGTQSRLDFVPEKQTDFIFTTFAEEWGYVGAALLLVLFVVLLAMLMRMALRCTNPFGRLTVAGTELAIFIYAFINIAMATGMVPVVGVPLPLVSYGGTAMLTTMIGIGLAMCAYVNRDRPIRRRDLGPLF